MHFLTRRSTSIVWDGSVHFASVLVWSCIKIRPNTDFISSSNKINKPYPPKLGSPMHVEFSAESLLVRPKLADEIIFENEKIFEYLTWDGLKPVDWITLMDSELLKWNVIAVVCIVTFGKVWFILIKRWHISFKVFLYVFQTDILIPNVNICIHLYNLTKKCCYFICYMG